MAAFTCATADARGGSDVHVIAVTSPSLHITHSDFTCGFYRGLITYGASMMKSVLFWKITTLLGLMVVMLIPSPN